MLAENSIIVRHASTADIESLSTIGSEAFLAAYSSFNTAENIWEHIQAQYSPAVIRQEMELPDRFYLLALVDTEPAGLCKMRAGPVPGGIPEPKSIEIQQLYIDPGHQRRGVGKAIVDAVFAEARKFRFEGVWLGVWEQATWAMDFYSSYGFKKIGVHSFRLGSTEQNDLLMWMATEVDESAIELRED